MSKNSRMYELILLSQFQNKLQSADSQVLLLFQTRLQTYEGVKVNTKQKQRQARKVFFLLRYFSARSLTI